MYCYTEIFFRLWYWLLNTLKPSLSPCYCRAGLRKEEPYTGNISSLRCSSVHLLMARTPCSKAFGGVLKHHPVQAPDEDRIFRCHWHIIMAMKPYPFSNKELCIQNISCPFGGSVRCGCQLLRKYVTEEKIKGANPVSSLLLTKVSQEPQRSSLRHIIFSVVKLYHPHLNSTLWEQTHKNRNRTSPQWEDCSWQKLSFPQTYEFTLVLQQIQKDYFLSIHQRGVWPVT